LGSHLASAAHNVNSAVSKRLFVFALFPQRIAAQDVSAYYREFVQLETPVRLRPYYAVSGIGFLGAGVIIFQRDGGVVRVTPRMWAGLPGEATHQFQQALAGEGGQRVRSLRHLRPRSGADATVPVLAVEHGPRAPSL
jgi:hypothetical protein